MKSKLQRLTARCRATVLRNYYLRSPRGETAAAECVAPSRAGRNRRIYPVATCMGCFAITWRGRRGRENRCDPGTQGQCHTHARAGGIHTWVCGARVSVDQPSRPESQVPSKAWRVPRSERYPKSVQESIPNHGSMVPEDSSLEPTQVHSWIGILTQDEIYLKPHSYLIWMIFRLL
ncbi:uncharacterized protein RBU33_028453 [Hipposideros larvatus]